MQLRVLPNVAIFTNNVYKKVTLAMYKIVSWLSAHYERTLSCQYPLVVVFLIPFIPNFALEYTITTFIPHIPDLIPLSQPNITY
jgi:hypothetical protein